MLRIIEKGTESGCSSADVFRLNRDLDVLI